MEKTKITPDTVLNFGKHKGKTAKSVASIDAGYIQWMRSQDSWEFVSGDWGVRGMFAAFAPVGADDRERDEQMGDFLGGPFF